MSSKSRSTAARNSSRLLANRLNTYGCATPTRRAIRSTGVPCRPPWANSCTAASISASRRSAAGTRWRGVCSGDVVAASVRSILGDAQAATGSSSGGPAGNWWPASLASVRRRRSIAGARSGACSTSAPALRACLNGSTAAISAPAASTADADPHRRHQAVHVGLRRGIAAVAGEHGRQHRDAEHAARARGSRWSRPRPDRPGRCAPRPGPRWPRARTPAPSRLRRG